MNEQSLYYFIELAKDLHMTRTAKRLYISQQTLSNHIMRLEKYYGVKLLNRHPKLNLTYAGEFVLRFAQKTLRENDNLLDILADIKHDDRGLITFGASSIRLNSSLPFLLPIFTQQFPNIEFRIIEGTTDPLEHLMLEGQLDLAITNFRKEENAIISNHIMYDQVYLCVTDKLLHKYFGNKTEDIIHKSLNHANIADFSPLPFCILDNQLGQDIQQCFYEANIIPKIYLKNNHINLETSIGFTGIAAFFSNHTSLLIQKKSITDPIHVFPLYHKSKPLVQDIRIIHRKDQYMTSYCRYFYELLQKRATYLESQPLFKMPIDSEDA